MEIEVKIVKNSQLDENNVKVTIEHNPDRNVIDFIKYIQEYDSKKIVIRQYNEFKTIDYKDIFSFYSDKRDIYCKTKDGEFKIKNTLYELEKIEDFLRISRSCIVNIKHIESFDVGETGKLIVKLDNGTEEIVSRRKVKEIMNYIRERSL